MNQTIQWAWEEYLAYAYPLGASAVQLKETRQAFMSGALVTARRFCQFLDMTEEERTRSTKQLLEEIVSHCQKIADRNDQQREQQRIGNN